MTTLDTGLRGFHDRLPEVDSLLEDVEYEHTLDIDNLPEYAVHAKFCDSDHLLLTKLSL